MNIIFILLLKKIIVYQIIIFLWCHKNGTDSNVYIVPCLKRIAIFLERHIYIKQTELLYNIYFGGQIKMEQYKYK
jgi:hypothetical protein